MYEKNKFSTTFLDEPLGESGNVKLKIYFLSTSRAILYEFFIMNIIPRNSNNKSNPCAKLYIKPNLVGEPDSNYFQKNYDMV